MPEFKVVEPDDFDLIQGGWINTLGHLPAEQFDNLRYHLNGAIDALRELPPLTNDPAENMRANADAILSYMQKLVNGIADYRAGQGQ